MSAPRVMILRAPGINCERETHHAFELAGGRPDYLHVQKLCAEPGRLDDYAIVAVPGGFAYGDDIAAGKVLANQLRNRVGRQLVDFVERGGLVLGICNGFQVLVRLGLLPRTHAGDLEQQVTLSHNLSDHYECRWVTLRTQHSRCTFVPAGWTLRVPAAHAEGYLQPKDQALGRVLRDEGYAAFVYVDRDGHPTTRYPANPNGSPDGLAGLTDVTGRVLGLMPHPDRAYLPHHDPCWQRVGSATSPDGLSLFASMVRAARAES